MEEFKVAQKNPLAQYVFFHILLAQYVFGLSRNFVTGTVCLWTDLAEISCHIRTVQKWQTSLLLIRGNALIPQLMYAILPSFRRKS